MLSIDECIEQSKSKKNISDGGSAAFDFGDYVLVKYTIPSKFGIARDNEELTAKVVNQKRDQGVRTPAHLMIKRTGDENTNVCWVLQEKAVGESFTKYYFGSNDPETQLKRQQELADAPSSHYDKCVLDLCSLFHMGLELKPKNIFYDNNPTNGGFTFIDLLEYDPTPLNPESVCDIITLDSLASFMCNLTCIPQYVNYGTDEQKKQSKNLYFQIKKNLFLAFEKNIPTFSKFKRWLLRTYPADLLSYLENHGIEVGNLALTQDEYRQFDIYIEMIVNECIKNISTGEKELWQIEINEVRILLDDFGMYNAWNIHRENPVIDPQNYEDNYEFSRARKESLESFVFKKICDKLMNIPPDDANPFLIKAQEALAKQKQKRMN